MKTQGAINFRIFENRATPQGKSRKRLSEYLRQFATNLHNILRVFSRANFKASLIIWRLQSKSQNFGARSKVGTLHEIIDPKNWDWRMPLSKENVPRTMGNISGKSQTNGIRIRRVPAKVCPKFGKLVGHETWKLENTTGGNEPMAQDYPGMQAINS